MSIFDLRRLIIEEYGKYVQSFFSIADERVREFIKEEVLVKRALWPDALLQINPPYEMAEAKYAHWAPLFDNRATKKREYYFHPLPS